jgi:hypothetical protein
MMTPGVGMARRPAAPQSRMSLDTSNPSDQIPEHQDDVRCNGEPVFLVGQVAGDEDEAELGDQGEAGEDDGNQEHEDGRWV